MKDKKLTISEIDTLVKKIVLEKSGAKGALESTYKKLKDVKKALKERGKKNVDLKKYKATMRELADELDEMEDEEITEMEEEEEQEIVNRNENSEGYGTFKGLEKIEEGVVRLSRSDLQNVVKRVIKESGKFSSDEKDLIVVNFADDENYNSKRNLFEQNLHEAPEKGTDWIISKEDRADLIAMGGKAEEIGNATTNDFSKYCR